MQVGFGIIGCGNAGAAHAAAIEQLPGARLVGVYDAIESAATNVGVPRDVAIFHSLPALLSLPDIQVVTIATPSGSHLEPALAAAAAGKHVIVEKPLEVTLERCDQLIRGCRECGVQLASVFPLRFLPCNQLLARAIAAGWFGRITLASLEVKLYRTAEYFEQGGWRGTRRFDGGGVLMNQAIHGIDLIDWLLGPVEMVFAQTARHAHLKLEVEDTAVAQFTMSDGLFVSVQATTATYPGSRTRLSIQGTDGSATVQEGNLLQWDFRSDEARQIGEAFARQDPDDLDAAWYRYGPQFADMLTAVTECRPPQIDGTAGRRAVELVLTCYRSAETGQPVRI